MCQVLSFTLDSWIAVMRRTLVPLNVSLVAKAPKLGDAVRNAKPLQLFKCIDSISKAKRIQLFTTVKDRLKFIQR